MEICRRTPDITKQALACASVVLALALTTVSFAVAPDGVPRSAKTRFGWVHTSSEQTLHDGDLEIDEEAKARLASVARPHQKG
jgi:hypothetical protein